MASVLISRNYSKAEKERTKKAPFLGLVAFPPGFEPGAFRLGGGRSILLSYGNLLFGCVGWRVYLHYLRRRTLYPAELRKLVIRLCRMARVPTLP